MSGIWQLPWTGSTKQGRWGKLQQESHVKKHGSDSGRYVYTSGRLRGVGIAYTSAPSSHSPGQTAGQRGLAKRADGAGLELEAVMQVCIELSSISWSGNHLLRAKCILYVLYYHADRLQYASHQHCLCSGFI